MRMYHVPMEVLGSMNRTNMFGSVDGVGKSIERKSRSHGSERVES